MKKVFFLVFIIAFQCSCTTHTKNELTFRIQVKPDTKYNATTVQTTKEKVSFSGSQEILQKLKNRGISNPLIKNIQSKTESVTKTGKLVNGKTFPVTMKFIKSTRNDGNEFIPDGTVLYGECPVNGMPSFDSIASGGLNENIKHQLIDLVQKTFDQLHSFPEKKLKVGESFSRTIPLIIPVVNMTIKMEMKSTYKLLSIKDRIGTFGITINYTITTNSTGYTISAKGSGNGKLLYDISENYYRQYQIKSNLEMNMDINNIKINNKITNSLMQTTSISKN